MRMKSGSERVILLHGLARSRRSFAKMERALKRAGFVVVNYGYASRRSNIETLAREVIPKALSQGLGKYRRTHFVAHSLGGILIRQYLSEQSIEGLGRVVMLGPPNKGSHVVDRLGGFPGFKWLNGPAGLELGTSKASIPNRVGPANFELGVITGTRSINWILSLMIPGVDDGKVSVENTKLKGMRDHLEVPVSHPYLMSDKRVIEPTIRFLKTGKFN